MKMKQQGFTLIELMIVVAIIGVLSAIAIPAYQDYTIRAQVSEGLRLSAGAKVALIDYYANNGDWPKDNGAAGLADEHDIVGKYTEHVKVKDNVIEIKFDKDGAHAAIRDKTLTLTATAEAGDTSWECASDAIEHKHLPSACRDGTAKDGKKDKDGKK